MSRWQEPIDRRPGRLPSITRTEVTVVFELAILVRPARATLLIVCDRSGDITVAIPRNRRAHDT